MSDEKSNKYWGEAKWLPTKVILEWCKAEPEMFETRKHAVISACQNKKIEYAWEVEAEIYYDRELMEHSSIEPPDFVEFSMDTKLLLVESASFAKWTDSFDGGGQYNHAAYCDPKHSYYAKELKIAVEAWTELYQNNPPQKGPKGGYIKYINDWLEKNHPELGTNAKKRIATIINPNPKGGASPT